MLELTNYSIDNLQPVYFKFKDTNKESIGLIAHEILEFYPFLVECTKDGNEIQSVNYIGLIGVLIKEIQVLKKITNQMSNKIEIKIHKDYFTNYIDGIFKRTTKRL